MENSFIRQASKKELKKFIAAKQKEVEINSEKILSYTVIEAKHIRILKTDALDFKKFVNFDKFKQFAKHVTKFSELLDKAKFHYTADLIHIENAYKELLSRNKTKG